MRAGAGAGGLADEPLDPTEWNVLTEMVVGQLRLRLPMRDAQFAGLAGSAQLAAWMEAGAEPRAADLARVGLTPRSAVAP